MSDSAEPTISEATRRNIADAMTIAKYPWSGRLAESEFLSRLYDLSEMESHDYRFKNAYGDIVKHREMNDDWSDDWVFTDPRFNLLRSSDEAFLRFLCEMVHPVVQPNVEKVGWVLETVNGYLAADGWEIAPRGEMSGRPIYAARRRIEGASFAVNQAQRVADVLGASYISQQITRMEIAVEKDPELAIGTAKEFVETICKTILRQCSVTLGGNEDLPQLAKLTVKQLKLTPDSVADGSRAADTIRVLLANLSTVAHKLAELRNVHGSGHGKDASTATLAVRHARLAVGAAITFGVFVFETYQAGESGL
jgi:hypothetical protein